MFAWHVMRLWAALNMDSNSNCGRISIFAMLGHPIHELSMSIYVDL